MTIRGRAKMDTAHTVLNQCNDLLVIYDDICSSLYHQLQKKEQEQRQLISWEEYQAVCRELELERMDHAQTRALLMTERERAQCAEAEVEVTTKQLKREKSTFDKAFGLLKSKSVIDSSKSEELLAKVTGLEALCKQKEEEILAKEKSIKNLQSKLLSVHECHKIELQQLKIEMQQELYMARTDVSMGTQKNRGRRKKT